MSDAPPLGPPPMRGPPPMGPRSALLGPLLAPDATPGALVFGRPRPTQGLMPNMGPRQGPPRGPTPSSFGPNGPMRGPSSGPNPGFGPGSGPPRFGFSHNSGKPGNVPGPGLNEVRPTMGPTGPAQNTAGPWKRYFSPEGKPYYYNTVTGETTWTDPLAPPSAVPTTAPQTAKASTYESAPGVAPLNGPPAGFGPPSGPPGSDSLPGSHPLGAPMKKVWETYEDNGKPYYYNVVSKQSVWDVPADLATAFIPATGSDPADAPPGVQQTQPQPIQRQLQQELPHGTPAGLSQSQLPGMVGGPPNMNNQISAVNGVPQKQAPAQLYMQQGQPMLYSKADPHLQAQPQTYSNTSAQPQTSQGVSGPQSNAEAIRVENDVTHIQITTKTTTEFTTATEGEDKKSVKNDKPVGKVKLTDSEWMVIITASGRKFYNNGTQSIWELPMELDLMGYDGDKIDEICKQYMRDKESRKRSSSKRTHSDQPEQDAKKPKTVGSIDPYGHVAVIPGVISDDDSSDHYDNLPEDQKEKHFKQMLEESSITAFDSFDVVKTRLMLDKRWNLVKPKEKRILFDVHVRNLNKRDRKPALQPKDHFMALLKEKKVSANTDWYKFAARYRKDHRFKNYGTDKDRVDMFQAYKLALDEEVPDVANQKHAIENSHKHTHSPSPSHNGVGGGHSHSDREEGFRQLLLDKGKVDSYTSYRDVKSRIRSDDRYDAMGSASGRERLFDELRDSIRRKDKEYLGREAIKKREKEGASQKSEMEAKTNKERSTYKQEEGQAVFTALLLHVVKNAMSWRVAKEDLRNDSRWRDCGLSADEKEALFREHTRKLDDKAAARYHNLIESYLNLKLDTPFEEVAKHIEGDPRYERFRSEDKDERKNEFERYMVQKKKMALKDFKNLLLETKQINYKTQSEILQNPGVVEHIKSILKQDKRYIDLDCFREERYTMMNEHITDMAQRGEPRPVTASVR